MKQSETLKTGRVTIPTNLDVVPETIEILKTPLDKSDDLRDKYLNEEGKE